MDTGQTTDNDHMIESSRTVTEQNLCCDCHPSSGFQGWTSDMADEH